MAIQGLSVNVYTSNRALLPKVARKVPLKRRHVDQSSQLSRAVLSRPLDRG